ncbi:MAG: cyclic nucleotide-binding domain-containing protein [Proteobacteria bacterium]|nr:cyclic nucleotide-binding domain-containing protein [Pseudomonadota bacterium]MBU1582855.1 cyclic nucleotide-binding domain-containing protein [Pseudomonadota bacterium]MBU2454104.1 cyclic nucleotide-binding domain-containing protein [Pseudomonadota bacterium]MBU2628827.1 cyclic nucleotide-binding domain-containing protein [Pseudomonadota bacterium]
MSNIKELLSQSSVFSSLEESDIERLAPLFGKWEIQPGEVLVNAKDEAQLFFLLDKGTLLVSMDKGKSVVLSTSGDFIGLELLSVKGVYKTTLTVLEKGNVFVISRQDFLAVIQEDSQAAAIIMESWQEYLDTTAPFVKEVDGLGLLEIF